jgi:hypothetical protein
MLTCNAASYLLEPPAKPDWGKAMRIVLTALVLCLVTTAGLIGSEPASAAPSAAAICKAARSTSLIAKVHCRVVRRCSYFGCSYEEVCT